MAGITHGLVTGVLVSSGLAYLTASQFRANQSKIHSEIGMCIDVIEKRNESVQHVSNVRSFYSSSVGEGVKDIWNEEIINAVNWWYNLKISNRIAALVASAFD